MKRAMTAGLMAGTLMLGVGAGYVLAQQAQQRNPGVRGTEIASADLGRHFESMQGKRLRMTRTVVDPGAGGGEHSHKGRPEVFYVLKGTVVEHQCKNTVVHPAGDGFESNADHNCMHRIENVSKEQAEVLVIQISSNAGQ